MRQSLLKSFVRQALKAGESSAQAVRAYVVRAGLECSPRAVRYVLDSMLKAGEARETAGALAFAR